MIFDTSSIYKAIETNHIDVLIEGKTLNLSLYELGNVIWKYVVRKKITVKEAEKLLAIIKKTIYLMEIVEIGLNSGVLNIASKHNISYYDASYIQLALQEKDYLITQINFYDIACNLSLVIFTLFLHMVLFLLLLLHLVQ